MDSMSRNLRSRFIDTAKLYLRHWTIKKKKKKKGIKTEVEKSKIS